MHAQTEHHEFDPAAHIYRLNGRTIPSVTQVLRCTGISRDLRMVRPDVLQAKRRIGSALHRCLHFLQERDLDPNTVDDQLRPYLSAYSLFVRENGFLQEQVEVRQWKTLNGLPYAGTFDVRGLLRGQPFIVDFKTTEGMPDYGWAIQLAAYDLMTEHVLIPPYKYRRLSLQLLSNGKYRQKEWNDPGDYDEWLSALALAWRRINRGEQIWLMS